MGTREIFNEGGVRWDGRVAFQTYPLTGGQELKEALSNPCRHAESAHAHYFYHVVEVALERKTWSSVSSICAGYHVSARFAHNVKLVYQKCVNLANRREEQHSLSDQAKNA